MRFVLREVKILGKGECPISGFDGGRKLSLAFEETIYGCSSSATFGNCPHNERLPATGISGHENAFATRLVITVTFDITPVVGRKLKLL